MDTKICCSCKVCKPVTDFWKMKNRKDGRDPRCRICARKAKRSSDAKVKARDPNAYKQRRKKYVLKYRQAHPERVALADYQYRLKQKFGLMFEDYQKMLDQQQGLCAICFNPPVTKRLAVDHDPTTSTIRGLLCSNCNTAIGLLNHDLQRIDSAKRYLSKTVNSIL